MKEVSRTRCLFIFLGLLIICMAATAEEVPSISVEADTEWLVAGSTGEAVVTATVTNGSSPQAGAEVVFSCDPVLGSFSRTTLVSDADGEAVTRFIPGTKSGSVVISAVWNEADGSVSGECEVGIDHAAPYRIHSFECDDEVTAGSTTEIVLSMEDEYENLIDDRHGAENVTFYVGSPGDGAHFGEGKKEITVQVNGSGGVSATLTTDTVAGENIVYIDLPGVVRDRYLTILGIGEPIPHTLNAVVDPNDRWVPANGEDVFVITYSVQDRYGNPCNSTAIVVNTSLEKEEDRTIHTNRAGRATITYGPKDSVGEVTIIAKTLENESLSDTQVVEFTSTEPVQMVLSAYPQMMPSGDVPNAKPAQVMAKVMDAKGNPVEGETVTFKISYSFGDTERHAEGPHWEGESESETTTTAVTDERGYAVALLYPGKFTGSGRSPAHAGCEIEAVWDSYPAQTVRLEWTNVPYLSVITNVTPPKAAWNETVEVNITLIGNGYKLQREPVDVVLVVDESGSMAWNNAGKNPSLSEKTRLGEAKAAAKDFVDQMDLDSGYDQIGLVTFSNGADLVQELTDSKSAVTGEIDDMNAVGATNMRKAFYLAIKHLKESGREDSIKAVILMSDGEWNKDGTPLAQGIGWKEGYEFSGNELEPDNYRYYDKLGGGEKREKGQWWLNRKLLLNRPIRGAYDKNDKPTPEEASSIFGGIYDDDDIYWRSSLTFYENGQFTTQNMSIYATYGDDEAEQVRLYTIGFASDLSRVEPYLEILSNSTRGRYTWAGNEAELKEVYSEIAGELREEAGVNTTLVLDFTNVKVSTNTSEWTVPGKEVFSYVPDTREDKVWFNGTRVGGEGYPKIYDDEGNWSKGELYFNVGTIWLNQTWQTSFHLNVLPNSNAIGNVRILDENSILTFNKDDELKIPDTYLTVMRALNNTPLGNATLDLRDLEVTGVTRQNLDLAWTLNYTGNSTVTETIEYRPKYGSWATAETRTAGKGEKHEEARLDIRDLPLTVYDIRVVADTEDAGSRYCITDADLRKLLNEKSYIMIE